MMAREAKKVGQGNVYLFIKRLIDIVISIVALILMVPIFIIMFIVYRFGTNKGPLFYKQERVGKCGKKFKIYKFRSMVVGADAKLKANKKLYDLYLKNSYKLPSELDPRITKLGRFLRKSSIDELPQFINIFKGEMTLIGPRPIIEEELKEYGEDVDKFLSVTPGAMGYWQASGRSNIEYPERCQYELYYVDHASFLFDLKILFKNIVSIFRGEGAY
ncbi:undecaprenyl-phosphate galactose phosphotransferase [Liquorilactobacillus sucicola DSM 21376 = JCM 15457]|uniref:Undecaprenyl-phosphate galactose phosphotransferase n=2 Tax=Liquorilactobacillus sucicola TaxID=519050 RepID=A0A0R2E218_9LACO|nr:undecaprenyl-phosphate galactose phosphotransferase [Liquorilactobacillus sucicola DSM 21376 = JCM 15457]